MTGVNGAGASPARRHRHDLDGLRGVAIALVAAYHVYFARVSGGVDVFLTLSGFFLIISLTSRAGRLADARLLTTIGALGSAWLRIARRLLPAAVVTLAGILVASWLLLPRPQWEEAARQALASLFYVENWHLIANESDYEAAGLAVSPLQHFWSLSVQGQFFLVIPAVTLLLAWVLRRIRPHASLTAPLMVTLGLAAAASFGYALLAVQQDQQVAYYHTLARGWEILAGGLVALVLPWLSRVATAVGEWTRTVVGVVALAAVLSCGFLIDGGSLFPGWATWWPVGATLLLIWAGSEPTRFGVDRWLATPPARWLGDHAYALYLWHWPVLIIYLESRGQQGLAWPGGTAVLVTSMALAVLTKRWIEDPMRQPFLPGTPRAGDETTGRATDRPSRVRLVAATTVCVVATVVTVGGAQAYLWDVERMERTLDIETVDRAGDHLGALVLTDPGSTRHVQDAEILPPTHLARADRPEEQEHACVRRGALDLPEPCLIHTVDDGPVVALVGGSHSVHLVPALRAVAEARGFTLVGYLSLGCPWGGKRAFGPGGGRADETKNCGPYSEALTEHLIATEPDLVIATSTRPRHPKGTAGDRVPSSYVTAWEQAVAGGLELMLVRDNPWHTHDIPSCVERHLDDGVEVTNQACGIERTKVLSDPAPRNPVTGTHWVDLSDAYCRPAYCNVIEGNVLIYRDRHHLTATYARTLAAELDRRLGGATGWWSGPMPHPR
ncbi:acyltransferase family protein [Nocardioides sp.]|uniref:acyltransferase family protein n=1 Tax=Nocardioides sp. TaxID=35761 RepID=UPI002736CC30|nr:acyltransferase family protein [Nocardioides sp.]MDP3894820.1 acyltransferase family protein [Nocardioides sp.]